MTTLAAFQAQIRTELSDAGTFWSDDELACAVAKTEGLLSRAIPKKKVAEITITHEITDAAFTVASSTGTTGYKPIEAETEVLKNAAGTTMVRGTNYTIDYLTGVITEIGALLPDAATYTISYHKDPQRLDITSLLSGMLKITRIEYPVGDKPPTYLPNFDLYDNTVIFGKDTSMTTGDHLRIYYDATWTGAGTDQSDYPGSLSMPVLIGAEGQALLIKAEKYVQAAITELGLGNAAADSMATPLGDINTALDRVLVYLTSNGTTDNAADVLANITDDIAELRTAIETALDKGATYLTAPATLPSAHYYLLMGDDYITTINAAEQVSAKYSDYARACTQLYNGLVAEATVRVDNIRTYIQESEAWDRIAEDFIAEATQRIAEAQAWGIQADKYITTNREYLNIAGRYLAAGQARVNEFYALVGNKPEIQQVRTSPTQATAY